MEDMEDPNTRYSKRLRTGTRRRYEDDGISDDEIEGKRMFDLDEKILTDRFNSDLIKYMDGKDFTFEYIQREGLKEPIVFKKSDGLGIQMPDPDFSVSDVKVFVGSRRIVDVMDVNTQKGIEMSMAQWGRYYETPPSEREKLYNVISLEFSHTKLEKLVQRPASVDLIDWVDNMWPRHLKERQTDSTNAIIDMHYPKVQKYCLMSVQDCFTDFHIDFGGTSVWYHILRGKKVFWLIPPSPQNLDMYESWVLSGKQGDIFLGDKCHDCQRIELRQGYTFMIPSGWIHAVYTPEDTLVFGGNFLHSFNIPMQLNIYSIEDRTKVPTKFRYPFFYDMCWYVLDRYLYSLTEKSHLTPEFQKYSLGIGLTPEDCDVDVDVDVNGNETSNEAPLGSEKNEIKVKKEDLEDFEESMAETKSKYVLTPLEMEGLWNLLGKLEELPPHKQCVPAGIQDAAALLEDMRNVLLDHADDDPKLSYTGEPIVKWPERPSWYKPPAPPPPPVLCRPRTAASGHKTKRSIKRSISAIRRRRVRCKRCAGCRRRECGSCQFCHDMRKFGGPGRMKKGCVLRQCLAPALPNVAKCAICGEGEAEDSNPSTHTLMECSVCDRIAHPRCIKEPGEGKINKDLPSCWECPKCYQGKGSASESSSEEESSESESSNSQPEEPVSRREVHKRTTRPKPGSHPMTPPPSQKLLLQHQQSRKRASKLELQLRKRIKLERSKIMAQKRVALERSSSRLLSRLKSPSSRMSSGRGRAETWASASSFYSTTPGSQAFEKPSSLNVAGGSKGESNRGRGRGVRLRGGAMGRGVHCRSHRAAIDSEDSSSSSSSSTSSSSSSNSSSSSSEDEEEGVQNGSPGGDKENQPQTRTTKGKDGNDNQNVELEQDTQTGIKDGFNKVTLQVPSKVKLDPSAIVPKLEAIASSTTGFTHNSTKPLSRPPIRRPDLPSSRHTPPVTRSGRMVAHKSQSMESSKNVNESKLVKLGNGGSASSSSDLPHPRVPLSALQEGSGDADRDYSGSGPACEREVWVSVFRYLSRADLSVCMAVCKNWHKWCLDKRLWTKIDLSIKPSVTPQALVGIIKRQPVTLDLSWTNISKKQLNWLIGRLPGLKDLMLAGCSWASISALCSPGCPLLRTLDLRYADGVKDAQIKELLSPPGCDNRSQLRNMQSLKLSGLDISDSTVRLVIRHMPHLTKLDLSHCNSLSDHSVNLLTAVGSSTRNTLTELNLAGCSKLTDTCVRYLRRLSCISTLDLRGCKGVSRKACEAFISELSVNTLYCLSGDKLIERIS